jgi:ADP-ribose pyrophosphatase YjhB (NUDIX family)
LLKILNIVGKNYFGNWDETRISCRGIILDGERILLSYETKTDHWMLPGGGLKGDESEEDCCIREIAEETGVLVETSDCMLEIDEYYENCKYVNRYFICKAIGTTERKLTIKETEVGMEPRWLPIAEIRAIFSKHASYDGIDEMCRGMYLREYKALMELIQLG